MTTITVHAEITPETVPYVVEELSNTVVINQGYEANRVKPNGFSGPDSVKNFGVCQPYYLANVLPISRGYVSVGFAKQLDAGSNIGNIRQKATIYGPGGKIALLVRDEDSIYVADPNGGVWAKLAIPGSGSFEITLANIRDVTYIHLGDGLYEYDFSSQEFVTVPLVGIPGVGNTLGVASASNQLILWDETTIYLSSLVDPLDFTPGLANGASASQIQGLRGTIVACVTLGKDFIIYSNVNAISAKSTGSTVFPFKYQPIPGAVGVSKLSHIAQGGDFSTHFVWTSTGFQEVSADQAQYVWAELSDGILRGVVTRLHPVFRYPVRNYVGEVDVQIEFVANRYLAVSTKSETEDWFYDCWMYDRLVGRWGKLSVPHVGFVNYSVLQVTNPFTYANLAARFPLYATMQGLTYRELAPEQVIEEINNTLGIVTPEGAVYSVGEFYSRTQNFIDGPEIGAANPTIILGRYKFVRREGIFLESLKIQGRRNIHVMAHAHDYTGRFIRSVGITHQNELHPGQYFGAISADAISIQIAGQFTLTDLQITFNTNGEYRQLSPTYEASLLPSAPITPVEIPEEITCVSTHLGTEFWRSASGASGYQFNEELQQWDTSSAPPGYKIAGVTLSIASGATWNVDYYPKQLLMTLVSGSDPDTIYPYEADIFVRSTSQQTMGHASVVFTEDNQEQLVIVDIDTANGARTIGSLRITNDYYANGPMVTCIQFADEIVADQTGYSEPDNRRSDEFWVGNNGYTLSAQYWNTPQASPENITLTPVGTWIVGYRANLLELRLQEYYVSTRKDPTHTFTITVLDIDGNTIGQRTASTAEIISNIFEIIVPLDFSAGYDLASITITPNTSATSKKLIYAIHFQNILD